MTGWGGVVHNAPMQLPPWNKGLHAYDRGYSKGYDDGLSDRPWPRLRRLFPFVIGGVLLAAVFSKRSPAIVRLLATEALLAVLPLLVVFGLPTLVLLHLHHRRALRPAVEEPFPD